MKSQLNARAAGRIYSAAWGPASGALSILIAAGLANIGDRLARGVLRREPDPHERALGYIPLAPIAGRNSAP